MSFLISEALAQDAGALPPKQGQPLDMFLMVAFIFGIFYFLLIRPQQRSVKLHKEMTGGIKRGDKVITGGGILGTITKIESDDVIMVEIAPNVVVQVARGTLMSVIPSEKALPATTDEKKKSRKANTASGNQVANDN